MFPSEENSPGFLGRLATVFLLQAAAPLCRWYFDLSWADGFRLLIVCCSIYTNGRDLLEGRNPIKEWLPANQNLPRPFRHIIPTAAILFGLTYLLPDGFAKFLGMITLISWAGYALFLGVPWILMSLFRKR